MTTFSTNFFYMSVLSDAAYAFGSNFAARVGNTLGRWFENNEFGKFSEIDHYHVDSGNEGFAAYVFQDKSDVTVKTIAFRGRFAPI